MHPLRFLMPADARVQAGETLEINGQEARHLATVLRARRGQNVELVDGYGRLARARVIQTGRGKVDLEISGVETLPDDRVPIDLITGMLKAEKMDLLIQKMAEIGIKSVRPVLTDHTVPRISRTRVDNRIHRWRQIVRQTLKQCRGINATEIYPVCSLEEALSLPDEETCMSIILDHTSGAPGLLDRVGNQGARSLRSVRLLVGPEGGFSTGELKACRRKGFLTASLGRRTLRAETAAIASVAAIRLVMDTKGWRTQ